MFFFLLKLNPSGNLLLLTVPRRYPYLHLYFVYVLRVFLTSWCMTDEMSVVCIWVCFALEMGLCFVLRFLLEPFLIYLVNGKTNRISYHWLIFLFLSGCLKKSSPSPVAGIFNESVHGWRHVLVFVCINVLYLRVRLYVLFYVYCLSFF